jgi:hypothetical protein
MVDDHIAEDRQVNVEIKAQLTSIVDQVETINGLTVGQLAERAEGRSAERTSEVGNRSEGQQRYVDISHDETMGHE